MRPACTTSAPWLLPPMLLGLLLGLPAGCGRKPVAEDDRVLASVGKTRITVGDFKRAMIRRSGSLTSVFADEKNKQALLDEIIRFELLAEAARQKGCFQDPAIVMAVKRMAVEKLEQDAAAGETNRLAVADEEVSAYYREHASEFTTPERVRVAMIELKVPPMASAEKKSELAAKAAQIREEALRLDPGVRGMGSLAARYSDDQASRYKGGDIGWIAKGAKGYRWGADVVQAALALSQTGAVSQVVADDKGLYIFRLAERQSERLLPLETLGPNLRQRIASRKKNELLDQICDAARRKLRVSVDEALLRSMQPPAPDRAAAPSAPPAMLDD